MQYYECSGPLLSGRTPVCESAKPKNLGMPLFCSSPSLSPDYTLLLFLSRSLCLALSGRRSGIWSKRSRSFPLPARGGEGPFVPRNPASFELSPLSRPPSSLSSYPFLLCRPSHSLAFVFLTVARRFELTRAHLAPSNARYCAALDTSSLACAFSSLFTRCVSTDPRPIVGRFDWAMLTCGPLAFADVTRRF